MKSIIFAFLFVISVTAKSQTILQNKSDTMEVHYDSIRNDTLYETLIIHQTYKWSESAEAYGDMFEFFDLVIFNGKIIRKTNDHKFFSKTILL